MPLLAFGRSLWELWRSPSGLRAGAFVVAGWLATSGAQAVPIARANQTSVHDVVITLQRTACFGACPVYTVTISGDGRVEYEGGRFVRVTGKASATITTDQVAALVDAFEQARYFDLQDTYTANITDMPTTITSLRIDGRYKRVIDYYGAPQVLKELERTIDRVAGTAQWVGGK